MIWILYESIVVTTFSSLILEMKLLLGSFLSVTLARDLSVLLIFSKNQLFNSKHYSFSHYLISFCPNLCYFLLPIRIALFFLLFYSPEWVYHKVIYLGFFWVLNVNACSDRLSSIDGLGSVQRSCLVVCWCFHLILGIDSRNLPDFFSNALCIQKCIVSTWLCSLRGHSHCWFLGLFHHVLIRSRKLFKTFSC